MGFKSEDAYTAELQNVLCIARALRDAAGISQQSNQPPTSNSPHDVINSINLPSPGTLLPSLLEAGFGYQTSTAISKTYQLRAKELRQCIQESVVTTCRGITLLPVAPLASPPDLLIRKIVFTFTELYLRRLEQWKEEIIQRVKHAPETLAKAATRNSSTFNHYYVPLLEYFFEENPFPTHADKMFLANKSNMQYRQIHVWFQNRRNRIRKEGRTLKKKSIYQGTTKPLDGLSERMKNYMGDPDFQAVKPFEAGPSGCGGEIELAQNNVSKDVFSSSSPAHAFPSLYPLTCHYDPFPCKSGLVCLDKPEWRRVSNGKPSPLRLTSIDNLAERFCHLNVRDGTRSEVSPKAQSHAAAGAITVTPSRAPHPSLTNHKCSQPPSVVQPRPLGRTPVPGSKAFQSASSSSMPILVSLSKSEPPGKRKIAPLPQRFPRQMRHTHRDTTPSESCSTSSLPPHLFCMNTESRSRTVSNIGSSSTPSDTLPHLFGSSCRSLFDGPIYLRGMGEMVAIPSSAS